MNLGAQRTIRLDQCLFGYDDGHRLLAASLRLPDDAASQLLLLTDLAPGLSSSDFQSYWTGTPVPSIKSYALIRTWPAPEMPRPGCVWSHVLIIQFADIPQFSDFFALAVCSRRPNLGQGFDDYGRPVQCSPNFVGSQISDIADHAALLILRSLYGPEPTEEVFDQTTNLDDVIFSVWSQQWPKLRRSFSFRTAVSPFDKTPDLRFQLRVLVTPGPGTAEADQPMPEEWELAALKDLRRRQPSDFRKFIWRYGSDMRHGFERFRFLASLYTCKRIDVISGGQLSDIFRKVQRTLPIKEDGLLLKQDLLSWRPNEFSLLPRTNPLDALEYFLTEDVAESFPLEPERLIDAVFQGDPDRVSILAMAERATARQTTVGSALISRISETAQISTFLEEARAFPSLRYTVALLRPEVLDSGGLVDIDRTDLVALLGLLPETGELVERVVQRLLPLDDNRLVADMLSRHGEGALVAILRGIQDFTDGNGRPIAKTWLQGLNHRAEMTLQRGYLVNLASTNALAYTAEVFGYDRGAVLRQGPIPWATALKAANDNIRGAQRDVFLAFLMVIMLSDPKPGAEIIFERTFEHLHSAIWSSSLSSRAFNLLIRHLPDVWWWQQWDNCLRLRIAVVRAYERKGLDPKSFGRLTADQNLIAQLDSLRRDRTLRDEFID